MIQQWDSPILIDNKHDPAPCRTHHGRDLDTRASLTSCHIPFWRFKSCSTRTHFPLIASSEVEDDGAQMPIIVVSNIQHMMTISDTIDSHSQRNPKQRRITHTSSILGKQRQPNVQREAQAVDRTCIRVGDIPPINVSIGVSRKRAGDWSRCG